MAITYAAPKPRGTVTTGDLVFFSADVHERVAICVLRELDDQGRFLQHRRLEFRDDTTPSFQDFAQGVGGAAFRNGVESYLSTLTETGGTQS